MMMSKIVPLPLGIALAVALAACGADPSENLSAPSVEVAGSPKEVASCLHTALEKAYGPELRTEDLSFKNEYRFTHSYPVACIAGIIGQCGTMTTWSISVRPKGSGTIVHVNASAFKPSLMRIAGACIPNI